jgi:tetratricopeptide (TPR) repeat protein
MPSRNDVGVIQPLSANAIPLIEWRLRDLSKPDSVTVMKAIPTCGNCHSFSREGRTLGMDMDGPAGDKGAYAVVPVAKDMVINTENVFSWNDYNKDQVTYGLFSRVSPDGRYVVSAVDEMVYVANYMDYGFLQTFYPTQGILAIYNRSTGEIKPLPGADDPTFVQANAVWSPDGKTIAFLKAPAKEAFRLGIPLAKKANDPNETQIKYDIYTIPFNQGRGGEARPLTGASFNGKSNSFPKFSPDGKWIVYVQANNGLLMRPDSELYIVPAEGGQARRMNCNTSLMNSWHSWSPNSRWLVFSSKSLKPYTQMFLTHIDENGNDSPAILVPNSTLDNRAVNIPEFVSIPGNGIQNIQTPAVDYRRHFNRAEELIDQKEWDKAFLEFQRSLELKSNFQLTLDGLGYIATEKGDLNEARQYFRKSLELDPANVFAYIGLGVVALKEGDNASAEKYFQEAVRLNPMNSQALYHFGNVLAAQANYAQAIQHYEKALEINPEHLEARFNLGVALNSMGRFNLAVPHFEYILSNAPREKDALHMLAVAVNRLGDVDRAIALYDQVLTISPGDLPTLNNLAWILATAPKLEQRDGARAVQMALKLCEETQYKIPTSLDTLAAAYAQDGQFELAVKWAARVLEMSDPGDPRYQMRSELRTLYSQKRAYPFR